MKKYFTSVQVTSAQPEVGLPSGCTLAKMYLENDRQKQTINMFCAPTIGITFQKEGVPDSHRVVNIEIKLQITITW